MSYLFPSLLARSFDAAEKVVTLAIFSLFIAVGGLRAQQESLAPVAMPVDPAALAALAEMAAAGAKMADAGAGAEASVPSPLSPNSFAQEALKKLADEMEKRHGDLEEAAVVEERILTPLPSGVLGGTHETTVNALMEVIFLRKGKSWFTQTVRDAHPVPYEMKDLQLAGPTRLLVTEADKANGIDQRISYGFSVSSHRKFTKATGWQAWEKGKPVLLTGIIMSRVKGIWVIDSSPRESFSLK
jgi:uncharacterized protein with PhoU and TrkA domain